MSVDSAVGYALFGTGRGLFFTGAGQFDMKSHKRELFEFRPAIEDLAPDWKEAFVVRTLFSGSNIRYLSLLHVLSIGDTGNRRGYIGHGFLLPADKNSLLDAFETFNEDSGEYDKLSLLAKNQITNKDSLDRDLLGKVREKAQFRNAVKGGLFRANEKGKPRTFRLDFSNDYAIDKALYEKVAAIALAHSLSDGSDIYFYLAHPDNQLSPITHRDHEAALKILDDHVMDEPLPPQIVSSGADTKRPKSSSGLGKQKQYEFDRTYSNKDSGVRHGENRSPQSGRLNSDIKNLKKQVKENRRLIYVLTGIITLTWLFQLVVALTFH